MIKIFDCLRCPQCGEIKNKLDMERRITWMEFVDDTAFGQENKKDKIRVSEDKAWICNSCLLILE